jgi:hypothetical protein
VPFCSEPALAKSARSATVFAVPEVKPGFDAPHPFWVDWGVVPGLVVGFVLDYTVGRAWALVAFAILATIWAVPTTVWRRRHRIGPD